VARRARESAHFSVKIFSSHWCLSAVVPAFAEPDIHLLPRARKGLRRRLSWYSLPVPKQSVKSLKRVLSPSLTRHSGRDLAVCALYDLEIFLSLRVFMLQCRRTFVPVQSLAARDLRP